MKEKKVIYTLLKETREKVNKLDDEIKANSEKIQSIYDTKKETKKNLDPEVEIKF